MLATPGEVGALHPGAPHLMGPSALTNLLDAVDALALPSWLVLVAFPIFVLAWYLSFTASRVDRLHHRVESARAALDEQLARRAGAALELAAVRRPARPGPPGRGVAGGPDGDLARAASAALDGEPGELSESAQNALTAALGRRLADPDAVTEMLDDPSALRALDAVAVSSTRVQLARRFHNDAVAQARRMRGKRVVRWARLAGRAPLPQMVEIDDSVPSALVEPAGALSWRPSAGPPSHPL